MNDLNLKQIFKPQLGFLLIVLSVFFMINTSVGQSTSKDQSMVDKIDELMVKYIENANFTGSVLVSKQGNIVYKKGFGLANVEWDIPNQTDTKFRIASVTKQFTSMLIMQLVAEGKLELDKPITTYLDDYPKGNGDKINIHHLLTHTSGVPSYTSFDSYRETMRKSMKPVELVKMFQDSTLEFTPGEDFRYSNSGYALLGFILEKTTGKSFDRLLKEKILEPLGMHNTGVENPRDIMKNRATGYRRNADNYVHSDFIDMSIVYTAGAMYSTVEDLYLWDQALYTEQLLPKKYIDMMYGLHASAWGAHYGYGWAITKVQVGNTDEFLPTIEHDGGINGFNSKILRIPGDQSSIIILNNTSGGPLRNMSKAICGILNDKSYDFPKKSIANTFMAIIKKDGLSAAQAFYDEVKEDANYYMDEREVNMASYSLLGSGNASLAAEMLQFGIEVYPSAYNLYDSYGEVLLAMGDTINSVKSYKKSLTLNPKNENGVIMLKKLGVDVDEDNLYLLKSEKSWNKEIFTFPLSFAPGIKHIGIEEAHFPKEWRDQSSSSYWSYVFAWNVDHNTALTSSELEEKLNIYFDGIMKVVNKKKSFDIPKAVTTITKNNGKGDVSKFEGVINTYDSFITEKNISLNVKVEKHPCKENNTSIILFRFSPKSFDHEIWNMLDGIQLRERHCEE